MGKDKRREKKAWEKREWKEYREDNLIVDMRVELRDKKDVEKRAHKREPDLERKERKRLIYYSIITYVPIIKVFFTTIWTKLK